MINQWDYKKDEELLHRRNVFDEPTEKIAKDLGYAETTIRRHLKRLGANRTSPARPGHKGYRPETRYCPVCQQTFKKRGGESNHAFIRRTSCYNSKCIETKKLGRNLSPKQTSPWPPNMKFEDMKTVEKANYVKLATPANNNQSGMGTAAQQCAIVQPYRRFT